MVIASNKDVSELLSTISEENALSLMKKYNKILRWVVADFPKFVAHKYPEKIGLIYYNRDTERKYTYKEINDLSNKFANFLLESGISDYDRVAILSYNSDYFIFSMFGSLKAKGVFVPLNYMLTGRDILYQVNDSESKVFLVEDPFYHNVMTVLTEMGSVSKFIALNKFKKIEDKRFLDFDDIITSYSDMEPDTDLNIWDPIVIMYTSGTESLPKGVIHTNQSLIAEYMSTIIAGKYESRDVVLHALPLYHCAQKDVFLVPYIWLGAQNIVIPKADIQLILEVIEKYKVNSFFAPPTVWIGILNHPDLKKYDLSSLEKGYYGASSMPEEVLRRLIDYFPRMKLWNLYGQTELAPAHTCLLPDEQLRKINSAGKEFLNMMTELMDENGELIKEPGRPGEIVGKGPHTMLGYFKRPEQTEEAFKHGWFHSGDVGIYDEDYYIYVVDRKKDMIKTGGENASSREVEEIIYKHPAVKEVAVVGLPDPKWIEAVTAFVVLKEGYNVTEEEIINHCKKYLAPFKVPKKVIFVKELPKNPSGKILKRELRKMFSSTK